MSVQITGIREVDKLLSDIDRRCTRERQQITIKAARRTLVPAVRDEAPAMSFRRTRTVGGQPVQRSVTLAQSVSARVGREGAVVVGPKGGKGGAWWRHFVIGGTRDHSIAPRNAKALATPGHPLESVSVRGVRANPFVTRGVEKAQGAFVEAMSAALLEGKEA